MGYKTWLSMPESTKEKYKMIVLFNRKDNNYFKFKGLRFYIENQTQLISFLEFLKECEDGLGYKTEHCLIGGASYVESALRNLDIFDSVLYTRITKNDKEDFQCSTRVNDTLLGNPDTHFKTQDVSFYENNDKTLDITIYE
jgi:dihydrofolate reductase